MVVIVDTGSPISLCKHAFFTKFLSDEILHKGSQEIIFKGVNNTNLEIID